MGGSGNNHINWRHVRSELLEDHPGEMYGRKLDIESQVNGKFRSGDLGRESRIFRRYVEPQRMSSPKERIYRKKISGLKQNPVKYKGEKETERQRDRQKERRIRRTPREIRESGENGDGEYGLKGSISQRIFLVLSKISFTD